MESEAVVDKVMRVKHKIVSKRGTRSIKKREQLWASKPSQTPPYFVASKPLFFNELLLCTYISKIA